jgi:hypothetical protein
MITQSRKLVLGLFYLFYQKAEYEFYAFQKVKKSILHSQANNSTLT